MRSTLEALQGGSVIPDVKTTEWGEVKVSVPGTHQVFYLTAEQARAFAKRLTINAKKAEKQ